MQRARTTILFIGDIAMIVGSFFATLKLGFWNNLNMGVVGSHILPFTILYVFWLIILFLFDLYDLTRVKPNIPNLQRIFFALFACLVIGVLFFYTLPIFGITPRTNLLINIGVFGILFFAWRRIFYMLFSANFLRTLVIFGRTQISEGLAKAIQHNPQLGYQFGGFVELIHDVKNLGDADDVVIAKPIPQGAGILKSLYSAQVEISDVSHTYERLLYKIPVDVIDESWFLHNMGSLRNSVYETIKRIISFFIAVVLMILALPILIIMAIAVASDGGPVFYSQERVGKNGKIFKLYKFRSMTVDAEKNGAEWASKNDTRVTRIGSIIRKLHIDELGQMFNILRGDISLVGPRPERPEFVEKLEREIPHYNLRHIITPGFTGWAQIKFRYARSIEDSHEKFQYDLYYIKNKNLFMDLGIILKTIQIIFTH